MYSLMEIIRKDNASFWEAVQINIHLGINTVKDLSDTSNYIWHPRKLHVKAL